MGEVRRRGGVLLFHCSFLKAQAALFEGYEATTGEDEMVQDLDIEQLAGFDQGAGNGDIIRAGGWIAGGMIVGDDDGGGEGTDYGAGGRTWQSKFSSPVWCQPGLFECSCENGSRSLDIDGVETREADVDAGGSGENPQDRFSGG